MQYKLNFKDKLYLMFHHSYVDRLAYLIPKVEEHSIYYFESNGIRKPVNFYKYVLCQAQEILSKY